MSAQGIEDRFAARAKTRGSIIRSFGYRDEQTPKQRAYADKEAQAQYSARWRAKKIREATGVLLRELERLKALRAAAEFLF